MSHAEEKMAKTNILKHPLFHVEVYKHNLGFIHGPCSLFMPLISYQYKAARDKRYICQPKKQWWGKKAVQVFLHVTLPHFMVYTGNTCKIIITNNFLFLYLQWLCQGCFFILLKQALTLWLLVTICTVQL